MFQNYPSYQTMIDNLCNSFNCLTTSCVNNNKSQQIVLPNYLTQMYRMGATHPNEKIPNSQPKEGKNSSDSLYQIQMYPILTVLKLLKDFSINSHRFSHYFKFEAFNKNIELMSN